MSLSLLPSHYGCSTSSALIFFSILFLHFTVHLTDATCNAAQSSTCLQAAADGQLDQLAGGGQCIVKQYVQYTHLCTVSNYMPTIDYCCCMFEQRLLCCRYHQDWYHFRCMETEDELEINSPDSSYGVASLDMPLLTLLPVILCPLVAIAVCIICWTKCWCYRYDNDSSSSSSSSSSSEYFCCRCCKTDEDKKEKIPRERFGGGGGDDDDATAPLQQPSGSSSAPEFQTSVHCLRTLHPYWSPSPAPHHFSSASDGMSTVYPHCLAPSFSSSPTVRLLEPSAPPAPASSADDLYAYLRRNPFDRNDFPPSNGNDSSRVTRDSDFLRMIPPGDPSIIDTHGVCYRRIPEAHRATEDATGLHHIYCTCQAFAVDRAHLRCSCDVRRPLAAADINLAHGHVPCADCLPPAYESINSENSAES